MKIEITVKIKNDDGTETIKPITIDTDIPEFDEFKGSDNFREVFDKCEKSVLIIRNKAAELALEEYLTELSKKKSSAKAEKAEGAKINEDTSAYEIEAEVGRLNIMTYRVIRGSRTVFNSRVDLFPKTAQEEKYHSACYDSLELRLASSVPSYRICDEILNRIRWQDNEKKIKLRTLTDAVEREGNKIIDYIDLKAEQLLKENKFDAKTCMPLDINAIEKTISSPEIPTISQDKIDKTIDEYNSGKEKERQIDETLIHEVFVADEHCINISVDDVGTVEQKETGRMKNPPPKENTHYVKNTVVHIQQGPGKYILDGLGIRKMLVVLTAFLLHNNLFENKCLIFFADGADNIKNAIKDVFGWRSYRIILDWYHLKKKCQERLSMAMKGREVRNDALKNVLIFLWLGKVDAAIEYLQGMESNKIKNKEHIEKLIAYFQRNWSYIPCYALRQRLGLRVSSNRGEKANDLVVAKRQKHNGMSWSKPGSSGLANVSAIFLNKEDENWINRRQLDFKLLSGDNKAAA